jgi:hypothetical protein
MYTYGTKMYTYGKRILMIGIHVPQSFSDILLFLAVIVSAQNATPPPPTHTTTHLCLTLIKEYLLE